MALTPAERERFDLTSAVLLAVERRAELLDLVAESPSADEARQRIREVFSVSEAAATHVMALEVRRFARDAVERVRAEHAALLREQ